MEATTEPVALYGLIGVLGAALLTTVIGPVLLRLLDRKRQRDAPLDVQPSDVAQVIELLADEREQHAATRRLLDQCRQSVHRLTTRDGDRP